MATVQNPANVTATNCHTDAKPYTPVQLSRASRKPSLRSKGSLRGAFVIPGELRQILVESRIEKTCALWLSTLSDVVQLDDQPAAVHFVRPDGTLNQHTFDFLAHFSNGRRIFFAVKDEARAVKYDAMGFLAHIAPQIPKSRADGVMLYTERTISPAAQHNASLFHAVQRDREHPADAVVGDVIATIQGAVQIADIVRASGYGALAFRAVVRLIQQRVLLLTADERIDYATRVTVAARHIGEGA
ncbi:hypothetical protein [Methylobacterium gregans]|uniref:TnsA endonuclease N-terminal domain-containing protein n=1 Tax=Methylobacterium gregans TaxID=374424 RepID=A0AA37HKH6_9HYPH|nr:hypothetical protein [Methylobacterium gregans]MDQ0518796.1 hypothetical protein [Methylobacterium gregans]GJD77367.1 hypothetical protein NBEOAGPD_0571 [Methylobacterium gregans]GLS56446.1 hypothetical protein GCM10007886_46310 [Methylobacterium gregans]